MTTAICRPTLALVVVLALGISAWAAEPLPIIPGAVGFGMETPAGSGRHVLNSKLAPDWDKTLVGSWSFDDATTKSNAGNAVVGKLEGDAKLVGRDKGKALSVGGKGLLNLANPKGYVKPGGSFTIMAWIKVSKYTNGGIVTNIGADDKDWQLTQISNGMVSFSVKQGEESSASSRLKTNALGVWRHVAGVYDSAAGTACLFVNGTRIAAGNKGPYRGKAAHLDASRSAAVMVGKGFNGAIDDVMLFGSALSEADIRAIFASEYGAYFDAPADVYRVTNLKDSGPGSLREAVETQERARTIVFEVSGNISLSGPINLTPANSWLTIAGETGPSPGITIKDEGIRIGSGCHDVLMRHVRIRAGDTPLGGVMKGGWTDIDGDGPRTVYSHLLKAIPGTHTTTKQKAVWWNRKHLVLPENMKGKLLPPGKVGRRREDIVANLKKGEFYWLDGIIYVNVGQSPDTGDLAYAKNKGVGHPLDIQWCDHMVIDHCSISWGGDHNIVTRGDDSTLCNLISAEALDNPYTAKPFHSKGLNQIGHPPLDGATRFRRGTIYQNLIAFCKDRNPQIAGDSAVVANNYTYGCRWGSRVVDGMNKRYVGVRASVVANVSTAPFNVRYRQHGGVDTTPDSRTFLGKDNMIGGERVGDPWKSKHVLVQNPWPKEGMIPASHIAATREEAIWLPGYEPMPVEEVVDYVLAHAGARPADRDPVDQRIIADIRAKRREEYKPIASQNDVGGWPNLAENHRKLELPEHPYADDNGDGYTNLENWLHTFAAEVEGTK